MQYKLVYDSINIVQYEMPTSNHWNICDVTLKSLFSRFVSDFDLRTFTITGPNSKQRYFYLSLIISLKTFIQQVTVWFTVLRLSILPSRAQHNPFYGHCSTCMEPHLNWSGGSDTDYQVYILCHFNMIGSPCQKLSLSTNRKLPDHIARKWDREVCHYRFKLVRN